MAGMRYFGQYARFDTVSKKDAAALLGADNLVGDRYEVVFKRDDDAITAWLRNRFGAEVGFFDIDTSRQLNVLNARGWDIRAVLSFVAYTDAPEPGHYWGHAALICNEPGLAEPFDAFAAGIGTSLGDGRQPDIDLGEQGVSQVLESNGSWVPKKSVPYPDKENGTAILKRRRKLSEKVIEQGRKGNKGCYAVSWAFLLLVVAGILFGLKALGVL